MSNTPADRAANLKLLAASGFRPAATLPTNRANAGLRPLPEIAKRLMALRTAFVWVVATEEQAPTSLLQSCIDREGLARWFAKSERDIFEIDRANANDKFDDRIGWRLENMWPLAWILGMDPAPAFNGEMIDDEVELIHHFVPKFKQPIDEFLAACQPRSEQEVLRHEDLFYCAHNAARSAQLGESTVPGGFHPVVNGGVIHERRHALTWATSPGVEWDETDLST